MVTLSQVPARRYSSTVPERSYALQICRLFGSQVEPESSALGSVLGPFVRRECAKKKIVKINILK